MQGREYYTIFVVPRRCGRSPPTQSMQLAMMISCTVRVCVFCACPCVVWVVPVRDRGWVTVSNMDFVFS